MGPQALACRWGLLLLAYAAGLVLAPPLGAQQVIDEPVVTWSEPVNLSGTVESSNNPEVAADHVGNVHVLWSEDVGGEPLEDATYAIHGNSLVYRRWDGQRWTDAVDILWVTGDPVADYPAAMVDAQNRLHVVWMGENGYYYSSAPAMQAHSPQAWTTPVALAPANLVLYPLDIGLGAQGEIYVLYSTPGGQVAFICSEDGGLNWRLPTVVSSPLAGPEVSTAPIRLLVDGAGRLHAAWQTNQAEGYGQTVYYARSLDRGETWSQAVQFAYRDPGETFTEYLDLAVVAPDEVHAIYIDGWHVGRWHRISRDGGQTWSSPVHVLMTLEGKNGFVIPLVDSANQLHLIINMRTREQLPGIFTAIWLGDRWSEPRGVDNWTRGGIESHFASATVSMGNEIHVVYSQLAGGEIWHVSGLVSNAPREAVARGTAQVNAPTPVAAGAQRAAPLPTAGPDLSLVQSPPPGNAAGNRRALIAGVVGALLLITVVVSQRALRSPAR